MRGTSCLYGAYLDMLILFAAIPLASALQIFGYFYLFLTGAALCAAAVITQLASQYKDKNAFFIIWSYGRSLVAVPPQTTCLVRQIPALPQTQKDRGHSRLSSNSTPFFAAVACAYCRSWT